MPDAGTHVGPRKPRGTFTELPARAPSASGPFPLRARRPYAPTMTASPVNVAQAVRPTCTRLTAREFAYRTRCVPVRSHAFPV